MRTVFLGPPGAGKGTQAKVFCERRNLVHLSTGELLRGEVKAGTPLGKKASDIMARGDLVPDPLVLEITAKRLDNEDCRSRGFVLDGYPRNGNQARDLDKTLEAMQLPLDGVVYFDVSRAALIERLSGRRVCPKCGTNYHVTEAPPKQENACDVCNVELIQRDDDRPQAIENRLAVYNEQTKALIDYYAERNLLIPIDAGSRIEEVAQRVFEKLKDFS
ncbi:MAG: adenylate kinase [Planctomycetota bacterium]|jgi:adenylate kinase